MTQRSSATAIEADPPVAAPPISYLLSASRMIVYLAWTLLLIPVQALLHLVYPRGALKLPRFYHRICCRILGVHLDIGGRQSAARPLLVIGNHISYLDITVYGATVEGSFVAKQEVARWPLFGLLAKLQRTVFIDRSRHQSKRGADALMDRLRDGGSVILFPEGTSGDGTTVLKFRSALMPTPQQAHDSGLTITVQPVTLSYTKLDGMPLGRTLRPYVAWYGDVAMAEHFARLLGLGRLTARVVFHDPVKVADFASRKQLTEYCYDVIATEHAAAILGR